MTPPLSLLSCTARAAAANLARLLQTGFDDEIIRCIWAAYAAAVPDEPDTIALAWPIVLPSGAVKPAT